MRKKRKKASAANAFVDDMAAGVEDSIGALKDPANAAREEVLRHRHKVAVSRIKELLRRCEDSDTLVCSSFTLEEEFSFVRRFPGRVFPGLEDAAREAGDISELLTENSELQEVCDTIREVLGSKTIFRLTGIEGSNREFCFSLTASPRTKNKAKES